MDTSRSASSWPHRARATKNSITLLCRKENAAQNNGMSLNQLSTHLTGSNRGALCGHECPMRALPGLSLIPPFPVFRIPNQATRNYPTRTR